MKSLILTITISVAIIALSVGITKANKEINSTMQKGETFLLIETADDFMRSGYPGEALATYQRAWSNPHEGINETQQVWLLLSLANAAVRHGDFEEAFEALSALSDGYTETGLIVGNPLFHLLVGLTYNGLAENEDAETDNFARALMWWTRNLYG